MYNKLKGITKIYKKDEVICNEGAVCNHVYYIIEGSVHIFTYTSLENVYTIATLSNGDSFGNHLIFSSNPIMLGNIIAQKKTIIKMISKATLLNALKNESFSMWYLKETNNKYIDLQNRIKILSQPTIREKILFSLETVKTVSHNNVLPITSIADFAKYLNIPRPSLSRELIQMKKDGLIEYNRHYIKLKKIDISF